MTGGLNRGVRYEIVFSWVFFQVSCTWTYGNLTKTKKWIHDLPTWPKGPKVIINFTNEINCIFHFSGCSRQDSIQIGEIYFKAWSGAGENPRLLQILEEDCIQNYMYHCVLANKKTKIFEPLLGILMPFHSSKNNKKVQKMLQSLWEPLLWRYLKVANSDVRCNATQILSEAFPLEDPDAELEVQN